MYARYQLTSLLRTSRSRGISYRTGACSCPMHPPSTSCCCCSGRTMATGWMHLQRRHQCSGAAAEEAEASEATSQVAAHDDATASVPRSNGSLSQSDRRGNFRFSRAQLRGLRPDQMPRPQTLMLTRGPEKKFVRRNGDWDCAFCSTVNPSSRWRCKGCSKEKEDSEEANGMPKYRDKPIRATESKRPEQPRGDWVCPDDNCGVLNFSRRVECIQCQTARPGSQPRKGDWKCPSCDTFNFAKRTECMRCQGPKVEGGEGVSMQGRGDEDEYEDARQPPQRRGGGGGRGRRGGGGGRGGGRRENDWECESCGSLNFGFRSECKQCGQPKE